MSHMLYMDELTRRKIIDRHEFYCRESSKRLISQLSNLEAEFNTFREAELDRLSRLGFGGEYGEDVPERANENAIERHWLLHDLKQQTLLMLSAGMYHQWDKELRQFIYKELRHSANDVDANRYSWKLNFPDLVDLLKQFGWDISNEQFLDLIKQLNEVTNVYKHGEGKSFERLKENNPEYFPQKNLSPTSLDLPDFASHSDLIVSETHFAQFQQAILDFWNSFPERVSV